MQFDSLTFIVFFALVALSYRCVGDWGHRKNLLLLSSYVFYAAWNPLFLPLLVTTSFLDWYLAGFLAKETNPVKRKYWLWAIIAINLGVLTYFKYAFFISSSLANAAQALGMDWTAEPFSIVLPIGISFYTFHSLSYCIDIYRRKFDPVESLRDYLLYVSFFPQLVAGPIVRWSEMKSQIQSPRRMTTSSTGLGLCLMILGLFEKIVLADTIFAPVADAYFSASIDQTAQQGWVATLAFSGQIFCDFAGYTTCALGAALILGFRLPINFLNPYTALGFSDFWRRWHITLSSWLRDYLYIGLGGSRGGKFRTARNLMLTMLIGGLWHGAAWTFVVWGGLHGLLLILERALGSILPTTIKNTALSRWCYRLCTLLCVLVTWVWFRSPSLEEALHSTVLLFDLPQLLNSTTDMSGAEWLALTSALGLIAGQWLMGDRQAAEVIVKTPTVLVGLLTGALLALIILSPGESHAFIYFQF
ncbi:MBOAT family O-acyltransferase [Gilvimarinus algae]|uniref:Probable alginate O-acetylase n=1 Tax=Gilvimarinus algae TaxID=3058037 RepID=A0ABT8THJ0_9GAMM|nr:MBOAT family O-acyltransferase [Gilvimarinus sp. SDUM040014]MDO3383566.1 MBOAT family O-acyltransferase [Gilvimarinus sp. SDUM040014]